MSTNLYLLFEPAESAELSLPQFIQKLIIPGYSFWGGNTLIPTIKAPGEPEVPVRCLFYAENYYRICISDLAILFYRESTLPPELAAGEKHLLSSVLGMHQFRLRRWVITKEGWDDDDNPYLQIVSEGISPESLNAKQKESST